MCPRGVRAGHSQKMTSIAFKRGLGATLKKTGVPSLDSADYCGVQDRDWCGSGVHCRVHNRGSVCVTAAPFQKQFGTQQMTAPVLGSHS